MAFDTPLLAVHRELGARLVEFAGWRLPLQFTSVAEEARACRQSAALFDISHMGLVRMVGGSARAAASRLVTRDLTAIPVGCAAYALLLDERAGILDDLFVMVDSDASVVMVVNAVNHEKDAAWIGRHLGATSQACHSERSEACPERSRRESRRVHQVRLEDSRGTTFGLALQGPEAEAILRRAAPGEEPPELFATIKRIRIAEAEVIVSRTGYTGEDGFEVFGEARNAIDVWGAVSGAGGGHESARPTPAGLAARDVLRQEMGYPLWGSDISRETTPRQAGLGWAVDSAADFIGREALDNAPVTRRRFGFVIEDHGVARSGDGILVSGDRVGAVSSGTYSHNLGTAIGQGYVSLTANPRPGMEMETEAHGKRLRARLASLPLIPKKTRKSWRQLKEA